jgi:hypothetical protein
MARETRTQQLARLAAEREAFLAEQKATYATRLMNTLQRAQVANFELDVSDMTFRMHDRDERDYDVTVLDLAFSEDADDVLRSFDRDVTWKEERYAEENRKRLARQVALNKLTTEERELLNVS